MRKEIGLTITWGTISGPTYLACTTVGDGDVTWCCNLFLILVITSGKGKGQPTANEDGDTGA